MGTIKIRTEVSRKKDQVVLGVLCLRLILRTRERLPEMVKGKWEGGKEEKREGKKRRRRQGENN